MSLFRASLFGTITTKADSARSHIPFSPETVESIILQTLSPGDMEHPFYRYMIINIIKEEAITSEDMAFGLEPKIPPPDNDRYQHSNPGADKFIVFISEKDELFVNSERMSQTDMRTYLIQLLSTGCKQHEMSMDSLGTFTGPNALIHFRADAGTSYSFYVETRGIVDDVYRELRDRKAVEVFGKHFDDLIGTEASFIRDLVPKNIAEVMD